MKRDVFLNCALVFIFLLTTLVVDCRMDPLKRRKPLRMEGFYPYSYTGCPEDKLPIETDYADDQIALFKAIVEKVKGSYLVYLAVLEIKHRMVFWGLKGPYVRPLSYQEMLEEIDYENSINNPELKGTLQTYKDAHKWKDNDPRYIEKAEWVIQDVFRKPFLSWPVKARMLRKLKCPRRDKAATHNCDLFFIFLEAAKSKYKLNQAEELVLKKRFTAWPPWIKPELTDLEIEELALLRC